MDYRFRDVFEFQEKYPTQEQREEQLLQMDCEEIMHLAHSCGNLTGAAYYGRFANLAREREEKESRP